MTHSALTAAGQVWLPVDRVGRRDFVALAGLDVLEVYSAHFGPRKVFLAPGVGIFAAGVDGFGYALDLDVKGLPDEDDVRTLLRAARSKDEAPPAGVRRLGRSTPRRLPPRNRTLQALYAVALGATWAEVGAELGKSPAAARRAVREAWAHPVALGLPAEHVRARRNQAAYDLAASGRTWGEVAEVLGLDCADLAQQRARRHAKALDLPWPLRRPPT